jgi:hypothetical protein
LSPYLISSGSPPPETAGTWHLTCLWGSAVGREWSRALEHSLLQVRQYELVDRTAAYAVVRNPRSGEVLAVDDRGGTLALQGVGAALATPSGDYAFRLIVPEYWLEWDAPVIAEVQARLRQAGLMPVREVAALLGVEDRLNRPDLLTGSVFRLDEETVVEWQPTAVGASVDYFVPLPGELIRFYEH